MPCYCVTAATRRLSTTRTSSFVFRTYPHATLLRTRKGCCPIPCSLLIKSPIGATGLSVMFVVRSSLEFGESFPVYSREVHGICSNDKTKFRCEWVDCGLRMNKERNRTAVQVYVPQLHGDVLACKHIEQSLTEEAHVRVRIVFVGMSHAFRPFCACSH